MCLGTMINTVRNGAAVQALSNPGNQFAAVKNTVTNGKGSGSGSPASPGTLLTPNEKLRDNTQAGSLLGG